MTSNLRERLRFCMFGIVEDGNDYFEMVDGVWLMSFDHSSGALLRFYCFLVERSGSYISATTL